LAIFSASEWLLLPENILTSDMVRLIFFGENLIRMRGQK